MKRFLLTFIAFAAMDFNAMPVIKPSVYKHAYFGNGFYMPTRLQRIKNKILRKRNNKKIC